MSCGRHRGMNTLKSNGNIEENMEDLSARSSIAQRCDDYRIRGSHVHRGEEGRPQISEQVKSEIRERFRHIPGISLGRRLLN